MWMSGEKLHAWFQTGSVGTWFECKKKSPYSRSSLCGSTISRYFKKNQSSFRLFWKRFSHSSLGMVFLSTNHIALSQVEFVWWSLQCKTELLSSSRGHNHIFWTTEWCGVGAVQKWQVVQYAVEVVKPNMYISNHPVLAQLHNHLNVKWVGNWSWQIRYFYY